MGIIIKNAEFPERCQMCGGLTPLLDEEGEEYGEYLCGFDDSTEVISKEVVFKGKPTWCPMQEWNENDPPTQSLKATVAGDREFAISKNENCIMEVKIVKTPDGKIYMHFE